jgi:two-component system chemotaxis response regulator CheY
VNPPSKVLVLEDSPMMCSLYRMVLNEAELHFAGDGVEGLDRAAQHPDVDIYIVDVNLPRMDGIEFIRRLRGELQVSEPPILVVSTECSQGDRELAYEAGADGYLCKPWKPEELLGAIEGLERRAER